MSSPAQGSCLSFTTGHGASGHILHGAVVILSEVRRFPFPQGSQSFAISQSFHYPLDKLPAVNWTELQKTKFAPTRGGARMTELPSVGKGGKGNLPWAGTQVPCNVQTLSVTVLTPEGRHVPFSLQRKKAARETQHRLTG